MRISDWSSDVCSSDLVGGDLLAHVGHDRFDIAPRAALEANEIITLVGLGEAATKLESGPPRIAGNLGRRANDRLDPLQQGVSVFERRTRLRFIVEDRSEEHTSELQ